jgi:hypothetical protein
MFSTLLVSLTARLKYCRVHQRAWVESLDQWMAFREPTLYGSPVTEAVCDTCTASRHVAGCGESRRGCRHDWEYSHSTGFSRPDSSALNRGHEHQRSMRRCNARDGRSRCFDGAQRGSGT